MNQKKFLSFPLKSSNSKYFSNHNNLTEMYIKPLPFPFRKVILIRLNVWGNISKVITAWVTEELVTLPDPDTFTLYLSLLESFFSLIKTPTRVQKFIKFFIMEKLLEITCRLKIQTLIII